MMTQRGVLKGNVTFYNFMKTGQTPPADKDYTTDTKVFVMV